MSGDRVIIVPTAQMMIHNVSGIANAYILKIGKSEKAILELLNKETWLSAKSALQQAFVDENS